MQSLVGLQLQKLLFQSHSPLGCPLSPYGMTRTFELFRKRFTLPASVLVTTYVILLSSSFVNHSDAERGFIIHTRYIHIILAIIYHVLVMIGKCHRCGIENVEVMSIKKANSEEQITLCNQCRPADGAYAY